MNSHSPPEARREERQKTRRFNPASLGKAALLSALALAFAVILIGSTLFRRSFQVQVTGSSMEPAIAGPRVEIHCPACGKTTQLTAEETTLDHLNDYRCRGCRLCGFTLVPIPRTARPGEKLNITPCRGRAPKRGEVVLVSAPDGKNAPLTLKRVLGLPGEQVEIVRGNILINGQFITDADWDQTLIPIDSMTLRRRGNTLAFTHTAPIPFEQIDDSRPAPVPVPLSNEIPRLEAAPPVALEYIHDFVLKVTLSASGVSPRIFVDQGDIRWLITVNRQMETITLAQAPGEAKNTIDQWCEEEFSTALSAPVSLGGFSAENGENDQKKYHLELRFRRLSAEVVLNGQSLLTTFAKMSLADWKKGENIPITTPAAIELPSGVPSDISGNQEDSQALSRLLSTAGGIEEISLYRGPCYSEPNPGRVYNVPRECYFLLGDNSAVSIDARLWPAFVPRESIRGVVTSCL